jgi:hypothetical protein
MGANTTIITGFIVEIENGVEGVVIALGLPEVVETTVMPIGGWEGFDKGTIMPPVGEM